MINDNLLDQLIRELIQIVDAIEEEKNYLLEKILEGLEIIGLEARNSFTRRASTAMLKGIEDFNMCREKDSKINKAKVNSTCPLHTRSEKQDYIMQYSLLNEKKVIFI